MKCFLKYFFLIQLTLAFAQGNLYAQVQTVEEAIKNANQALSEKDFEKAILILKPFEEDRFVIQLLAQTYYWNQNIQIAKESYQKAIAQFPEQSDLQLDYGRMLYELGEGASAKQILSTYLSDYPNNVEANMYLGYLFYKEGNYKQSRIRFQNILLQFPHNEESQMMLESIDQIYAWRLETGTFFRSDNQPMRVLNPFVKLDKFKSNFLYPDFLFDTYFFDTDTVHNRALRVEIGNSFFIPKAQLKMRISSGIFSDQIDGKSHWVGSVLLDKKLSKNMSIVGNWNHQPVFDAASSLNQLVTADDLSLSLKLENGDLWMGQATYQFTQYFDDNSIQTGYLWLLSPALKWKISNWRIGYAGSYSNARENRFTSDRTLDEILDNYMEGMTYHGRYVPYFTPHNQMIHSVIGLSEFQLNDLLFIKFSANVSLNASADIPFFYLDNSTMGVSLFQDFYLENTTNIDLKAELKYAISHHITLNAHYQYTENFFYEANTFLIKINWVL